METIVSSKGQVVIPAALRRKLKLKPGDRLDIREETDGILMRPMGSARGNFVHKPGRKHPILSIGNRATIRSAEVEDILNETDV
ncbi:MAG: AbrB/MazE/SpoVT family DNA-binding domain-containing protein [Verrucomicrobiota bacterium JB024]|jgi:AbrB family looped-hinge helix DNA binding protein|nr:AbrB/MazE/SpoVT family DNA-binding domain-containing protein [Verrucomicrobiota bacterium JB024]